MGLCWVLATPGRPTWHMLLVLLLPGQGIFVVFWGQAACWVILAGFCRGEEQRGVKDFWVTLEHRL